MCSSSPVRRKEAEGGGGGTLEFSNLSALYLPTTPGTMIVTSGRLG